jgi:hypothetical protein
VPFDFLRRGKKAPSAPGAEGAGGSDRAASRAEPAIRFDGLTDEWRLTGTMHADGRLSDILNRREAIAISGVSWAPIDGSKPFEAAPGLKSIDPYDLIAVLAGPDTLPAFSESERAARRVRKEPYDVVLEAPPYRITGTVHVFPGSDAQQMLEQTAEMFVPLTEAVAYVNDRRVADPGVEVVLVNRLYVRGVEERGG